jgi:uncharacterized membrane protein HdeD (DUF308 family)
MGLLQIFGGLLKSLYAIPTIVVDVAIGAYLIFDGIYSAYAAKKRQQKEMRGSNISRYARISVGASYTAAALSGILGGIGASITRKLVGAYMVIDGLFSLYYGLKKKMYSGMDANVLRVARASIGGFTLLNL